MNVSSSLAYMECRFVAAWELAFSYEVKLLDNVLAGSEVCCCAVAGLGIPAVPAGLAIEEVPGDDGRLCSGPPVLNLRAQYWDVIERVLVPCLPEELSGNAGVPREREWCTHKKISRNNDQGMRFGAAQCAAIIGDISISAASLYATSQ